MAEKSKSITDVTQVSDTITNGRQRLRPPQTSVSMAKPSQRLSQVGNVQETTNCLNKRKNKSLMLGMKKARRSHKRYVGRKRKSQNSDRFKNLIRCLTSKNVACTSEAETAKAAKIYNKSATTKKTKKVNGVLKLCGQKHTSGTHIQGNEEKLKMNFRPCCEI